MGGHTHEDGWGDSMNIDVDGDGDVTVRMTDSDNILFRDYKDDDPVAFFTDVFTDVCEQNGRDPMDVLVEDDIDEVVGEIRDEVTDDPSGPWVVDGFDGDPRFCIPLSELGGKHFKIEVDDDRGYTAAWNRDVEAERRTANGKSTDLTNSVREEHYWVGSIEIVDEPQ